MHVKWHHTGVSQVETIPQKTPCILLVFTQFMITSPTQGSPSTFLLQVSHWPLFHLVFNIVFNLKLSQVCLLRKTLSYVLLFSLCSTHFRPQKNFLSDQVIYSVNVNSRHRHLRSSTAFLLCNYWVTDVCIGSTYLLDIEIHLSFFESFNLANTFMTCSVTFTCQRFPFA